MAAMGGGQSTLHPDSPQSRDIAELWWWMLAAAAIVFAGAVILLIIARVRRRPTGLPLLGESEAINRRIVVMFGIAVPVAALVALFIVADLVVVKSTQAPAASSTSMTIRVIGHQWFWEARYPGTAAVTANEIHIPARTRVNVIATTDDVIHSLWVPALNRKVDMIPGKRNRLLFYADKPGDYRGQCAELCGLQHAHMALEVVADPPERFRRWLRNMAAPRRAPSTPGTRHGEQVFQAVGCASCHTIRGTPAAGTVGPDLTHLATRATLAGLTIPNNRVYLGNWVANPQHVKPGNKMPALPVRGRDLSDLLTYLESLR